MRRCGATYGFKYEGAQMPRSHKKESILVVDDDHDFTDMMLAMLTQPGYTAVTCNSPGDALSIVSSGPELIDMGFSR
jgi:CheY-like chemotaxis protein